MELNDFKDLWKSQIEDDLTQNKQTEKEINQIIMKSTQTLTTLQEKNISLWKTSKFSMVILIFTALIRLFLFFSMPEISEKVENTFTFYLICILTGLLGMGLHYELVRIFEATNNTNLREVTGNMVARFKRWYALNTVAYFIALPLIFFTLLKSHLPLFDLEISVKANILISLSLTILCMVGNHIYYKRTYFKWFQSLQKNLNELKGI